MKTQEELRAEFRRLMDADLLDEAEVVLEQMEPMSLEELHQRLDDAPIDDEPLTAIDVERVALTRQRSLEHHRVQRLA